ncbi:MAG: hypothetical protein GX672_08995 [Synergistaceae bacterium]|nr:hypothetical protein [Synergistaceae bacterium]
MKSINMDKSAKRPLVLLGFSVVLLLLLVAWSLKVGPFSSFFKVEEAVICQELGDNREPLLISNSIPYGPSQICLWLKYSSASEGSHLEVSWYYGNELVLSEPLKLMTKDGVRTFYLLREEGTPLPVGSYRVNVSTPAKVWSDIEFEIVRRK